MTKVMTLREHTGRVKQLSFDLSGTTLTASCVDGMIYAYSLSSEQPQLIRRVDGLIKMMLNDSYAATRATWHPDGRAFVVPTQSKGEI